MALFGRKKKESAEVAGPAVQVGKKLKAGSSGSTGADAVGATHISGRLSEVLRAPRITEKASASMSTGIYAFDVADKATKRSIAEAVFEIYKVRPRMVRIVNIQRKVRRNARTGQYGMSRGGKKAYVYLKKGETITIT